MRNAFLIFVIIIICVVVFYAFKYSGTTTAPSAQSGLPWQIEHIDSTTRVFNLTLGKSRLADAAKIIGTDFELAILAKPGQPEALELYSGNFRTGSLTGSMIVVADVTVEEIQKLRNSLPVVQEHLETGTKKTTLRYEQQDAALAYTIKSITFIPVASITQDLLVQRFGQPVEVFRTAEKVTHYLYPQSGLSVIVNDSGRDFLQYVAPSAFAAVQHETALLADSYALKVETAKQAR